MTDKPKHIFLGEEILEISLRTSDSYITLPPKHTQEMLLAYKSHKDLLKACKETLARLEKCTRDELNPFSFKEEIFVLEQAIAKAKGEV